MRVQLVQGDITEQRVDAIVNAANHSLLGGGGVDGAIHRAGGPEILAECRQVRAERYPDGLPTGQSVATTAGRLPARWVIHTVGRPTPRPRTSRFAAVLLCNESRRRRGLGARTLAFPLVSAGIYGWPKDDAIRQALTVLTAYDGDREATMVLFDRATLDLAEQIAAEFP